MPMEPRLCDPVAAVVTEMLMGNRRATVISGRLLAVHDKRNRNQHGQHGLWDQASKGRAWRGRSGLVAARAESAVALVTAAANAAVAAMAVALGMGEQGAWGGTEGLPHRP